MFFRKSLRNICFYGALLALASLVSCQRYNSLVNGDVEPEDLTTTDNFSAPVPGNSEFVRVVHIFRFAKPGAGSGGSCSAASTKYALSRNKWWGGEPYYVNPANNSGLAATDAVAVVDAGFTQWNQAEPAAPVFNNSGTSALPPGGFYGAVFDGVNTVSFGDTSVYGSGVLAVTNYYYSRVTRQIVEFDQIYNDAISWAILPNADEQCVSQTTGSFDLPNVIAHEHGHIFGLNHPGGDTLAINGLTMYAYASPQETLKRTLGDGDKLGLRAIY